MIELDHKKIQETNAYSCLECGKCTGTCPVARYSNTFSPRQILTSSLHNTHPDSFMAADLWSCLTCMRCDEVCPSNIHYTDFIQFIREFKGIENRQGTCSHGGIIESITRIMTSPNLKQNRLSGLNGDIQKNNKSEYLYFMGCLPYFDVLFNDLEINALSIAANTLKILNYFGVKPQILSDEKCCGHDAFWNGDLKTFTSLAAANLKLIEKSGAKKIITSCPECYRTLKVDYPRYFGSQKYEIMHISEFLSRAISSEKPDLRHDPIKVTYQDPCRLGRHLGIYKPPREALSSVDGLNFIEMAHHHKRSVCCGVSGWMNCSQVSKKIQTNRLQEAKSSGAEVLVTSCVKCQIHFKCAMKDKHLNEDIPLQIADLTEVIAESLH